MNMGVEQPMLQHSSYMHLSSFGKILTFHLELWKWRCCHPESVWLHRLFWQLPLITWSGSGYGRAPKV